MTRFYCVLISLLFALVSKSYAQDTTVAASPKLEVSAYLDIYYLYDFNLAKDKFERPYFVSSNRHNEFSINLAYIGLKYETENWRTKFQMGVGTYMNANYASESTTLKHIVEANAGVRLSKKHNIWLDAGVFSSPITNETQVSKDQWCYTRSFAPENVPYYLSGTRLSIPINSKLTWNSYIVNGWQLINDNNYGLSAISQLEYKPNAQTLINWNIWAGDESSPQKPNYRTRFFSDVYVVYQSGKKWSWSSCLYAGLQQAKDSSGFSKKMAWYNANIQTKYALTERVNVSGRIEYFGDRQAVLVGSVANSLEGFESFSETLGINCAMNDKVLIRFEGRYFHSPRAVFLDTKNVASSNGFMLSTSIGVGF